MVVANQILYRSTDWIKCAIELPTPHSALGLFARLIPAYLRGSATDGKGISIALTIYSPDSTLQMHQIEPEYFRNAAG